MKTILFLWLMLLSAGAIAQAKSPSKSPVGQAYKDPNQKYLDALRLPAGSQWNAAFVYWCFNYYTGGNPLPKTGSGIQMWNQLPARNKLTTTAVRKDPAVLIPGNIFFIREGNEARVGIVESVNGEQVNTIEADSQVAPGRTIHTDRVIRKARQIAEINLGFSNFGVTNAPYTQSAN